MSEIGDSSNGGLCEWLILNILKMTEIGNESIILEVTRHLGPILVKNNSEETSIIVCVNKMQGSRLQWKRLR